MKGLRKFALSCCLVASSGAVSATEIIEHQFELPSLIPFDLATAANGLGALCSVVHPAFARSADESARPVFAKEAI